MRAILPDELDYLAPGGDRRFHARPAKEEAAERAALIEAAVAEARAAERARAEAEAAEALRRAEAATAAAVAEARAAWAAEEGAVLAAALADGLADLEDRLAAALARLLAPVVSDLGRARMLEAFRRTLDGLLADPDAPPLALSGPADLLDGLSAACPDLDARAVLTPDAGPDLRLVAGPTRIATRLEAFAAALARAGDDA